MYVGIYNCIFFGTLGGHFLVHEVTSQPASQPAFIASFPLANLHIPVSV